MKKVLISITLILMCLAAGIANACTRAFADKEQSFIVSGVMSKKGEDATIKLIHSALRGPTERDVLQKFVKAAIVKYPEYKMVTVLATKQEESQCMMPNGVLVV